MTQASVDLFSTVCEWLMRLPEFFLEFRPVEIPSCHEMTVKIGGLALGRFQGECEENRVISRRIEVQFWFMKMTIHTATFGEDARTPANTSWNSLKVITCFDPESAGQ